MRAIGDIQIAGRLTIRDWKKFRVNLTSSPHPDTWKKAFDSYFHGRLIPRYLKPIEVLQKQSQFEGEGFSIVAIQCSLIEFLESTLQGKTYRYRHNGDPALSQHEYSDSKGIFVSFLAKREPFRNDFDKTSARDFYESARCGLLHEARTKNGWTISARKAGGHTIDPDKKIIYRNNFQTSLITFVEWYKTELPSNRGLQEAFIRKFDSLCL